MCGGVVYSRLYFGRVSGVVGVGLVWSLVLSGLV